MVAQTGTAVPASGHTEPRDRQPGGADHGGCHRQPLDQRDERLSTGADGADAHVVSIAQQAGIFTGFVGSTRPTLQTDGNFTAVAGDIYRLSEPVQCERADRQIDRRVRVALGDGGGNCS